MGKAVPPEIARPGFFREALDEIVALGHQTTALGKLDALIGLSRVKREIEGLISRLEVQARRRANGMHITPVSLHMVFVGAPATGKTTVARLVADIYRDFGLLKRGQLVEVDPSSLVAGRAGQSAINMRKAIDRALDGVLFIDEAYGLANGSPGGPGVEAINTLLKAMEDRRDRLAVIVAGYPEEMKRFLAANRGLGARFNRTIEFEDYTSEELLAIFLAMTSADGYELTSAARHRALEAFVAAYASRDQYFGNARFVRNFFEKTQEAHARRVRRIGDASAQDLNTIIAEDVG